jgi:ATP-dependent DNA ligase
VGYSLFIPPPAVPEPSTWAMMLLGFAVLGYAGYRRSERPVKSLKPRKPCDEPVAVPCRSANAAPISSKHVVAYPFIAFKAQSADRLHPPAQPILVAKPPAGPEWLHEVKHDGYRLVARKPGGHVVLWSRHGTVFTDKLPRIAAAVRALPADDVVLDDLEQIPR